MPCNDAWRVTPDQIMADRSFQSSLLTCRSCNTRGAVTWNVAGDARTLTGVAGDFHLETGRTMPAARVIVCSQCDEIHEVLPADRAAS